MAVAEKKILTKENPLATPLIKLPGIGDKTAATLAKNDIHTVFDLLLHAPKSVVEQIHAPGFFHMETGRHYIATGKVVAVKTSGFGRKRRLEAILSDETGRMTVVFFGPAVNFAETLLKENTNVTVSGEAKRFLGRIQMVHPKFITEKNSSLMSSNLSTYAQIGGLNSATFKRIVDKALAKLRCKEEKDYVFEDLLHTHKMSPLKDAFVAIHDLKDTFTNWDERGKSPHFRRLAFEEVLSFYVRLSRVRREDAHKNAIDLKERELSFLVEDFLPFTLTDAQSRAILEILHDMSKKRPMTRLLQGDVGSGKTAVSAVAAHHAALSGLQVAVMAPTEILAEQLFFVYQQFFAKKPHRLALLTASTKTKERKILLERIISHDVDIVIGTHALLTDDVIFKQLGLVIVDEQHRFGVKQRAELLSSCETRQDFCPHLLVMSATPIPRSLALTLYGDLELSVIDERPKGRIPVHTQILLGPVLNTMERLCERILLTKQKAFIVFPLVLESEHLDLENATKAFTLVQEKFGKHSSMLLHGKMKADEKALAMAKFKSGEISLLVSTTVVEVGVDVPDATCILIMHPERFGLAQLHQLRGRVGRKDLKSFCFLISDITNKFGTAYQRLNALAKTDNGFKLAEIDLEMRGPGELLGVKQSGLPNFLIFSHSEFADLISPAKAYAKTLSQTGLNVEHHHLYVDKEAHFC